MGTLQTDKKAEKPSPYVIELLKRTKNVEFEAVKEWIKSGGKFTLDDGQVLEGPNPNNVAQEYINSFKRLQNVCQRLFPGRPLIIQETGHSWDIDVFITYLTHKGIIDEAGFVEVAKGEQDNETIISEFESPVIKISDKGASLTYRDKTYEFDPKLL